MCQREKRGESEEVNLKNDLFISFCILVKDVRSMGLALTDEMDKPPRASQ